MDNQFPVTVCSQAHAQSLSEDPEEPARGRECQAVVRREGLGQCLGSPLGQFLREEGLKTGEGKVWLHLGFDLQRKLSLGAILCHYHFAG